ncbi:MAG: twin-arginine translocase subunit TatC [Verrucomicrobia bacterium]|jgi:sec-independent protein translocase protein TatC|nr:twin-arginine translocase subunit TatC [Verrucomicrobiota bacterium]
MTLQDEHVDAATKPFVEHLDDLRKTVLWIAGLLSSGILIAIPLAPYILKWLKIPYYQARLDEVVPLAVNQVGGGLAIAMRVVIWSGLLMSLPFVVLAVSHFIFPGLKKREKQAIVRGAGFSIGLFVAGVWMGYRWTVPIALQMMSRIEGWMGTPAQYWETQSYVGFVLKLLIAFGITFQLPVVLLVLGNMGLISSAQLRDKRRHVVVGLMVLAMFLTPSDPFTMLLMAAPLVVLYESCIWLIWAKERKNRDDA